MVKDEQSILTNETIKSLKIPALGMELIRHISLPDLLGEDSHFIQYHMGKNLARKFPLASLDEISSFFADAGFGSLQVEKEKKDKIVFTLESPLIQEHFRLNERISYRLEAGFLAQQLSALKNMDFECMDEPKKGKNCIYFHVITSL